MKTTDELHQDQIDYWNGPAGNSWVEGQDRMDRILLPVQDAAIAHARAKPGETVIDVGCGCGSTTLALAALVGPTGRVIGPDVSAPMVALARKRSAALPNVEYVVADAASHPFPPAIADLLFSRFGVMFFGDPRAAFANMRRALKPTGRVVFACWRKLDENKWMQVPLHAVYEHVPRLPKPEPEDPGPLSFADSDRVTRILTGAGFAKPKLTPVDLMLDLATGRGLDEAVLQCREIGPASRALKDQPPELVAKAVESIRAALPPYVQGHTVKLPGAIWLVDCAYR